MNSKFLVRGIAGGVTFFLLGWVVWGMLLLDFMTAHTSPTAASIFRAEADFIYWAMLLGNLGLGFLLTYVLDKGGETDVKACATTGAIVGSLVSVGCNFILFAQMDLSDTTAIVVDIAATSAVSAVAAAVIGLVGGKKK